MKENLKQEENELFFVQIFVFARKNIKNLTTIKQSYKIKYQNIQKNYVSSLHAYILYNNIVIYFYFLLQIN